MKAEQEWRPTKYSFHNGRLSVGPDVGGGSWSTVRLLADAYERHLPNHARGRLVDLGCGTVPLYSAYRGLVESITCVDWGGGKHDARHLDVEHDLNHPLPFDDASFDTAILSDVLEHVRRPDALLLEIARVLSPSGKLLLNVPFLYWLHEQPHDYFRYTEHALRMLIEQAGLRVLVLEAFGGGPVVLADVAGKHLNQVPVLGNSLARALQYTVHAVTRSRPAQSLLRDSRQRFPLGYFLVAEKAG